jgi:lycopene cyclase domain-containing protein
VKSTYLLVNLATISLPLLFSFHPRIAFVRRLHAALPAILLTAILFIAWDIWFTHLGIWAFNPRYVLGIEPFGLPVEEILFFFCIPYASLFIYDVVVRYLPDMIWPKPVRSLALLLGCGLIMWTIFVPGFYTRVITTLTGLTMIAGILFWKHFYRFVVVYFIHLLPFFVVNGILTALPVVTYSEPDILGLRLGTIPVEDALYAWLLLLGNVAWFEYLKNRPRNPSLS